MTIPSDADPGDTKARLREAALDLFGRHGIHATSTREIIAAAGLRNPSAINYYFGSKAGLVEDLAREINSSQSSLLQRHVALAGQETPLTPTQWAEIGVDFVIDLMSTDRGCRLCRVWGERDDADPDAVERFLGSAHPLAAAWRDAVATTFPDLPLVIAIARNVIVIRTLTWITVRRARRILSGREPSWQVDLAGLHPFLIELSVNILTPPTTVSEEDLAPPS